MHKKIRIACLLWGAGMLIGATAAWAVHATNGQQVTLQSPSTDRLGMSSAVPQAAGRQVTLAISPCVSKMSSAPNHNKVLVGPAALVRQVADVAAAGNWHWYH